MYAFFCTSTLGAIKGIGDWTVDMILLFTLGRADILPIKDNALKKIMAQVYELDPKHQIQENVLDIAQDWVSHRSLGVRYLLAWKTQLSNKIIGAILGSKLEHKLSVLIIRRYSIPTR